jgi:hypothetical protein
MFFIVKIHWEPYFADNPRNSVVLNMFLLMAHFQVSFTSVAPHPTYCLIIINVIFIINTYFINYTFIYMYYLFIRDIKEGGFIN